MTTTERPAIENALSKFETIADLLERYDAALKAADYRLSDDLTDEIMELPLEVSVRSAWAPPADALEPVEFRIVLTTGGPACRIVGDLDGHGTPVTAELQWQDWGTGWVNCPGLPNDAEETLLRFAQRFYYGG